jgi:hypothetical protein
MIDEISMRRQHHQLTKTTQSTSSVCWAMCLNGGDCAFDVGLLSRLVRLIDVDLCVAIARLYRLTCCCEW